MKLSGLLPQKVVPLGKNGRKHGDGIVDWDHLKKDLKPHAYTVNTKINIHISSVVRIFNLTSLDCYNKQGVCV